jgi:hypothetical protein
MWQRGAKLRYSQREEALPDESKQQLLNWIPNRL